MELNRWLQAKLAACLLWLRAALARGRVAVLYGEAGQSMVEYALVAALIAVVAMVAVGVFGTAVGTVFQNMTAKITGLAR
jgi:Flp pilus assembly pilin Flp